MQSLKGEGLATAATDSEARKIVGTGKRDEQSTKPSTHCAQAARKSESLQCPICECKFSRRSRQQRYCSPPCMRKANYIRKAGSGLLLGQYTAFVPNPPKSSREINNLQRAKTQSSARIIGPPAVIQGEVFAGREWREVISAGGVKSFVCQLRKSALVGR